MAAVMPSSAVDRVDDPRARHIRGQGTPETSWRVWPGLSSLPTMSPLQLVPRGARIVVVSPHPDDEILGCGGVLATLARHGREVVVVAVTDGEGSHPGSSRWTPSLLARERCDERSKGLERLGIPTPAVRLRLADGGVTAAETRLIEALRHLVASGDVLLATWCLDGHPDHEAVGRAAVLVAAEKGCPCWQMPVWMWHWAQPGDASVPWRDLVRIELDSDARLRKRHAIAAHATQLEPRGDGDGGREREAVLPDWALARTLRSFECLFATEPRP